MKKISFLACLAFAFVNISMANNLTISSIVVNQPVSPAAPGGTVSFNVAWDNSWNIAAAPSNWDAIWVFVKFKDCAAASSAAYTHGTINATTANHTFGSLDAMTTGDGATPSASTGSAVQGAALDYSGLTGIMLRRNTSGSGSYSSSVTLTIDNLPNDATTLTTSVYGIEMVYVPNGAFSAGDGNGVGGSNSISHFTSSASATVGPYSVAAANETAISTFYVSTPSTLANVPAAWPKGVYGFYMMKHEISQGMYAEFLNNLGLASAAQIARNLANVGTNRNQTQLVGSTFVSTRPERAQNWMAWSDVSAFLDWACLRPLTELEYEKAARGVAAMVTDEYPWGMAAGSISVANTFAAPAVEIGTETVTGGNAIYTGFNWANGDGGSGPCRVGILATAVSTRQTAGAGYYGALELAGNVMEFYIGMHTTAATNAFTRVWGNGSVTAAGIHDVAGGWPASAYASVAGFVNNTVIGRGGAWADPVNNNHVAIRLQTSDRYYASSANLVAGTRYSSTGGRGGR